MRPTTIMPLCDKDFVSTSAKDLIEVESPGIGRLMRAYVCEQEGCFRCYSKTLGYFFFVAGKSTLQHDQVLCPFDARPTYLQFTMADGEEIWRCPESGVAEKI